MAKTSAQRDTDVALRARTREATVLRAKLERKLCLEKEAAAELESEKRAYGDTERRQLQAIQEATKSDAAKMAHEEEQKRVSRNRERIACEEMEAAARVEKDKLKAVELEILKDARLQAEAKEEADRRARSQDKKARADEEYKLKLEAQECEAEVEKAVVRRMSSEYMAKTSAQRDTDVALRAKIENGREDIETKYLPERDIVMRLADEKVARAENERCLRLESEEVDRTNLLETMREDEDKRVSVNRERIARDEINRAVLLENQAAARTEFDIKFKEQKLAGEEEENKHFNDRPKECAEEDEWLRQMRLVKIGEANQIAIKRQCEALKFEEEKRLINEKMMGKRSEEKAREDIDSALLRERLKKEVTDAEQTDASEKLRRSLLEEERNELQAENERIARDVADKRIRDETERFVIAEGMRLRNEETERRNIELSKIKAVEMMERSRIEDTRKHERDAKYREIERNLNEQFDRMQRNEKECSILNDRERVARIEYDRRRSAEADKDKRLSINGDAIREELREKKEREEGERRTNEEIELSIFLENEKKNQSHFNRNAEEERERKVSQERRQSLTIKADRLKALKQESNAAAENLRIISYERERARRDENAARLKLEYAQKIRCDIDAKQSMKIERRARDEEGRQTLIDAERIMRESETDTLERRPDIFLRPLSVPRASSSRAILMDKVEVEDVEENGKEEELRKIEEEEGEEEEEEEEQVSYSNL